MFIYGESNGFGLFEDIQRLKCTGSRRAGPFNCALPRPMLRASMEAQAWHYDWAVPGTCTTGDGLGYGRAVLFSVMPVSIERDWPFWPSIMQSFSCG